MVDSTNPRNIRRIITKGRRFGGHSDHNLNLSIELCRSPRLFAALMRERNLRAMEARIARQRREARPIGGNRIVLPGADNRVMPRG